jgi:molybdate transport system substrate-binding protein
MLAAKSVAYSTGASGIMQINVILPVAGADYVGPLPAEFDFAVGVLAVSKQPDAAQAMVKFMSSHRAAAALAESGNAPHRAAARAKAEKAPSHLVGR